MNQWGESMKTQSFILEPAYFRLDGGAMYGIIPKPLWNKRHPADSHNRIDLALRLWLLKTPSRLILVDTGIGDYHDPKFKERFDVRGDENPLEKSLQSLGYHCEDITDLIITHLHFDHVGGIGLWNAKDKKWRPTFPHATLHLHEDHYQYAHNCTARDQGSFHTQCFDPVIDWYREKKQIHWHKGSEGELFPLDQSQQETLRFKCSYGHTPHLMHPYTDEFIYLADLIPTAHHVSIPWVMGYDIAPGQTTKDKETFLPFISDKNLKVIFEHDPDSWGATLEKNEKGEISVKETFPSQKSLAYSPE